MPHNCHARNCEVPVPPKMLMCRRHWYMVPREMRNRVWNTYQRGQEIGQVLPTEAWFEASKEAIEAVAIYERNAGANP